MPALQDLAGIEFGFWTVERLHPDRVSGRVLWVCRCVCGSTKPVFANDLKRGKSVSCGCQSGAIIGQKHRTHGRSKSPEYTCWQNMKARCYRKSSTHFADYGGRGIVVCDRWRASFEAFVEDMGSLPFVGAEIDRIDNAGNYEPGNCRWAGRKAQCRNRRTSILVTRDGKTMSLIEWCETLDLNYATILSRVSDYGWDPEEALSTPITGERDPATGRFAAPRLPR